MNREKPAIEELIPLDPAPPLIKCQSAATDPQGSWTGVPDDPWDVPVQDADDL